MRFKMLTAAALAILVAAAFFLPEFLLNWGDRQLLDSLHMESQDEEREGFAESIQLTVPEKVMLLRSGGLTVMELNRAVINVTGSENGEAILYTAAVETTSGQVNLADEERYAEETEQLWEDRMTSARTEIRTLQTMGGLPEIWKTDMPSDYTGYGDLLYLDPDSYMSFQVYQLTLHWENYSLDLLVDQQSERILSFALRWVRGAQPNWGPRGASSFGSAWRDYWRMDSVATGWYNEHSRSILETVEAQVYSSNDYAAHDQITFMYDSQSIPISLDCQGSWSRNFSITWNR